MSPDDIPEGQLDVGSWPELVSKFVEVYFDFSNPQYFTYRQEMWHLLHHFRELRGFINAMEQPDHPAYARRDEWYQLIYKVMVADCLRKVLRGVEVYPDIHSAKDLIEELRREYNDNNAFTPSAIYGADSSYLYNSIETEITLGGDRYKDAKDAYPELQAALLSALDADRAVGFGLMTKGVFVSFGQITIRLLELIEMAQITEEQANIFVNLRMGVVAVTNRGTLMDPNLHTHIPPFIQDRIRENLQFPDSKVVIFDEVISRGLSIRAVILRLVELFGAQIIPHIMVIVPGYDVVYDGPFPEPDGKSKHIWNVYRSSQSHDTYMAVLATMEIYTESDGES